MIAESVRKYYKPTPENSSSFINGMAKRYEQLWNEPYENVPRAIPICFAFLQAWAKPKAWQYVAYDVFTNALCMGGYFEEAQVYKKKLYRSCVDYYGEIHQITGYVAIRVGAMYHNSLQFAEAKVWYQKAYDILSQSKPYNGLFEYQRMQAAHTLCRNDRHEGKYDSAMRYLEECLRAHACYMEQNPKAPAHHRQERYFLLLEKAKILVACSKWEEAEALCRELEEEYRNENTEWVHFFEELYLLWAELALKLGKEVEAVQMAKESVSIAQTMRGEYAKETLGCKEVLADAYALANKRSESIECYREILEKLQQYYPLQKEWYQKVYRKECAYVKEENMFSMD